MGYETVTDPSVVKFLLLVDDPETSPWIFDHDPPDSSQTPPSQRTPSVAHDGASRRRLAERKLISARELVEKASGRR